MCKNISHNWKMKSMNVRQNQYGRCFKFKFKGRKQTWAPFVLVLYTIKEKVDFRNHSLLILVEYFRHFL